MNIKPLPVGFVVPAQPVKASKPPSGADWVHEIKHDGYRIIVRRDGPTVRLYSRNANDWSVRLSAIAAAAARIEAKSFTIDGEAVVLGPDGLSRFEEPSRREGARTAILYAFDLIEHDDEDMRNLPFLDRPRWRGHCATPRQASCSMNTLPGTAPVVFAHACRLGAEGIVSKKIWDLSIRPLPRLDQGPQSGQHRRAAGQQRDLESMRLRQRADVDRPARCR
jgi:bifunctional non-homologous end joining protein LigD